MKLEGICLQPMRLKENCGVARYGADKKERGESHEWTAGPMAVDNKQLKKYNKSVSLQIDLTWFHSYYCIIFSSHSLHSKNIQKIYINFKKYQCNFNKNLKTFNKDLKRNMKHSQL